MSYLPANNDAPSPRGLAWRIARLYLAPRWKAVTVAAVCAVLFAGFSGLLLRLLQPAVDELIGAHAKLGALITLPLTVAAIAVGRGAVAILQSVVTNRMGHGLVGDIQRELVGKLMHADLARLRATHSGGFVSQVLYDAGLIREAATTGLINWLQQGLTLAAGIVVMFTMDWALTLLVLVIGPIVAWVLKDFSQRTTKAAKGAMQETSSLATAIMESLDGVRVVKMENREAYEEARVGEVIARRQEHIIAGANARATAAPVSEMLSMLVTAAVFAYAGWRAYIGATHLGPFPIGTVTTGSLTAFIVALAMSGQSLRAVTNLQTVMAEGLAAAGRLFNAMDVQPEVADAPTAGLLPASVDGVALEDVSFAYGAEAPVLDGVSLRARRGEIVALVGPSGAGKSTILNLIPRFYDVTGGRVTIGGEDIRNVTLASLRSRIALVTQEPFLFDDTIAANIAYSRDGATAAQIENAARQAAAHEFILALPQGYQTRVGEAGARLSGGQRQRIAIARAFLKDAPILLLDEATSALDTESEAQVQLALERLMAGRATILIAHRLSTVRGADRIYVIDHGRVVETGAHAELVGAGGLYARLARTQDLEAGSAA